MFMELAKKISLSPERLNPNDEGSHFGAFSSSETTIPTNRKNSILTEVTENPTYDPSEIENDQETQVLEWFRQKGVKAGNPEELLSSVT